MPGLSWDINRLARGTLEFDIIEGYEGFSLHHRVAPHQTVVRCSCKANGGPDILLVAMFSTHSQEERHGPHDDILPQRELSCQRPERPGQYRYPFAEGAAVHLSHVSQNLQRSQRHRLLSAAHLSRDCGARRHLARPWVSRASDCGGVWV